MPELLRDAVAADHVHALRGPTAVLDPVTSQVLEAAVAEASARAFREGEAAGRAAATDAAACAGAAVSRALDALLLEVRGQLAAATRLNLEFAAQVATAVLERTPPDDATAVLDRVGRAVGGLDDPTLQVRLHPDDHARLTEAAPQGLELVADTSVASGDARVIGLSGGAELTREAMLVAAIRVLAEDRA